MCCIAASAQEMQTRRASLSDKHLELGIFTGVSLPTGSYHSALKNDQGLAKAGWAAGVEGTYFFSKYLGVNASVAYQLHPTDAKQRAALIGATDPNIVTVNISSGSYEIWNTMLGLEGRYPVSKNFSISLTGAIGMQGTKTPEIEQQMETHVPSSVTITSAKAVSFAYQFKLSAQYHFSPRWTVSVFGAYMGSNPKFTFTKEDKDMEYSLPANFINLGVGLRYSL